MSDEDDHDNCFANLSPQHNDISIGGGKVLVWRDCQVCGDEFVTEYEYVETIPA